MNSKNVVRKDAAVAQSFPWGRLTWFASRTLGNAAELTTGCCEILPQAANPRHSHPNCEEVLHVLRGRIAHTLGDDEIVLEAGDTIAIPPRVPHNARNLGREDAVLTISFSSADRQTQGE